MTLAKSFQEIYIADLVGNAVWEDLGEHIQIEQVLKKGQVKSTRNRGMCMRNLMKVVAKGVCKDRSKWKELICAYLNGKRALCYICI
jgi:hypothetical protein